MEIHRDYPCNAKNCQRGRALPVSFLVLHYVGAEGGAEANAKYYGRTPGINASAHYFVDHGPHAEVWASVPEGDTAWHCGRADHKYKHPQCRNANSIGIEMCCHERQDGSWYIDPETVDRTVELSQDIMERYHIPVDHVLRHFDVTGKFCPQPWVEDPRAWQTFKARLEDNMTQEQFNEMFAVAMAKYEADRAALPVPDWGKSWWESAEKSGLMDGTRPMYFATRLELAVTLNRLGLIKGNNAE